MWTRRRVILAGVVVTTAAGGFTLLSKHRRAAPPAAKVLLDEHQAMFDAFAVALLGPALPSGAGRAAELSRVRAAAVALIDNLPVGTRRELADLFFLLSLAPARRLLGYAGGWAESDRPALTAFLQHLRTSTWSLKPPIYFALHDIVYGSFYAAAHTWAAAGYPGPPLSLLGLSPVAPARSA